MLTILTINILHVIRGVKMKKLLIMLVALTMLIQLFSFYGCTPSNAGDESEISTGDIVSETSSETPEDNSPVLIFDRDTIYYTIIRGSYAESVEVGAAVDLNAAFRDVYPGDWKASIKDDFVIGQKKDDIFEVEGKEILIGITNRKESHDLHETLSKNQYVIKVVGEKIVIVGYDNYATAAAVECFISTYLSSDIEDKFELAKDMEIRGESSIRKIALHDEAQYRIMTWNLGCMVSADNKGELECVDIILRYYPDILGLQECNAEVHNKVLNSLPECYAFANKKHANGNTVNYTPIIYNTELFTLIESDLVWLRGRYTGTNTKSLNWAVFEDMSGQKFALINFHGAVCSNSYKGFENYTSTQLSQQALEWKLDNVVQVLEIKSAITEKYGDIPIMISGDNNFNSSSQPYINLTSEGFVDAELTARVSSMTGYKTSYSYGTVPGEGLSIDHIFGINGLDFVVHGIVRGDDVWKASDHSPVFVDFNLK